MEALGNFLPARLYLLLDIDFSHRRRNFRGYTYQIRKRIILHGICGLLVRAHLKFVLQIETFYHPTSCQLKLGIDERRFVCLQSNENFIRGDDQNLLIKFIEAKLGSRCRTSDLSTEMEADVTAAVLPARNRDDLQHEHCTLRRGNKSNLKIA